MSTIVKHTDDYTVLVPQQAMRGDGKKIKDTIETAIFISRTVDNNFHILKMANQTNTDKPLFVVHDRINDKYHYFVRTGLETSKYLYYLINIPETDFPILSQDENPPTDSTILDTVCLRKYTKQNDDEDSYDIYIVKVLDDMIHILCFQKIHGRGDQTTLYRFFIYDIQENKSYWARSHHDSYNIEEWIEDPKYFTREIENITKHMKSKYDEFNLDVDNENCELKITLKIPFKWEPVKISTPEPTIVEGGAKRRHKKKKRNTRRNKKSQKRRKRKRNTRRKK